MTQAVGISIKLKDNEGVVVQRRSETDSFPRGSQVTATGKIDQSDNPDEISNEKLNYSFTPEVAEVLATAAHREILEENGADVAKKVLGEASAAEKAILLSSLLVLSDQIDFDKGKRNLTLGKQTELTAEEFMELVEPEEGVYFSILEPDQEILPWTKDHHKRVSEGGNPVPDEEIRMFRDEALAINKLRKASEETSLPSFEQWFLKPENNLSGVFRIDIKAYKNSYSLPVSINKDAESRTLLVEGLYSVKQILDASNIELELKEKLMDDLIKSVSTGDKSAWQLQAVTEQVFSTPEFSNLARLTRAEAVNEPALISPMSLVRALTCESLNPTYSEIDGSAQIQFGDFYKVTFPVSETIDDKKLIEALDNYNQLTIQERATKLSKFFKKI